MIKKIRPYLLLFGIAAVVIALDQWSKWLVEQNLGLGEEIYPIKALAPFFRFTNWQNTGAAFGLFQNANLMFLILAIIISVLLVWTYHKSIDEPILFRISLSLMLGGAIGNIIDRIRQGFVTDFVAVGRFPVFNVADSAVTIGVGLMLLILFLQERKEKRKQKAGEVVRED